MTSLRGDNPSTMLAAFVAVKAARASGMGDLVVAPSAPLTISGLRRSAGPGKLASRFHEGGV
jgi:hypothetical protein